MEASIKFQNAWCAYDKAIVLQNINLEIKTGAWVGLVGPSGSGKTTLLKAILGLAEIPKGSVSVFGNIGYVPQLEMIDWNFPVTVEQVVFMGLHDQSSIWPWMDNYATNSIYALLKQLDMYEYRKRHVRELSGGQQQRVFLARALIRKPNILLLDEPTNGIDVKTRHALLHLLKDLNKSGMTIVLTTHDLNSVAAHLPWIICFNKKFIAQGTPKDIFTEEILSKTYEAPLQVIRHTGVVGDVPVVTEK